MAWAPVLGRPSELVAVASGANVTVWSLRGPVDALEVPTLLSHVNVPMYMLECCCSQKHPQLATRQRASSDLLLFGRLRRWQSCERMHQ